jgi:uncharacterized membrane-anchored protein YhcB (DUF1043 family)
MTKAMWIGLIIGLVVGMMIGFFAAGLCRMAADECKEYSCNCGMTDEEVEAMK